MMKKKNAKNIANVEAFHLNIFVEHKLLISEKWAPHVYKKSPDYFCVTKLECSSSRSITKSMKHVSTADDDRAAALAKLRRAKENGELLHQTSRLPKPFAKNLLLLQGGNSSRGR